MRLRFLRLIVRCQMWQPKPYVAHTAKDEPMSWWFYRKVKGCEVIYERNWLGTTWSDFWHMFIGLTRKR